MSDTPTAPSIVRPYPAGTQWTFRARGTDYVQTTELALLSELNGSSITDEHVPEETSAQDLWTMWVDKHADYQHKEQPTDYHPGEVRVYWTVTTPALRDLFELAPHSFDSRATRTGAYMPPENFATFYTSPVNALTREPLNWLRLSVLDRGWNTTAAHKGGFIQEVTGWKPSPLQPTVDIRQLGAAAGLYVPPL
ncbi:hypothetical protein AB0N93_33955 [Streptomyces sp. NPDC091267]|uniref:hypothetical protein n=1 Tax=unclassified Streptomyces TaxID=2593676 RepID=UPI003417304C